MPLDKKTMQLLAKMDDRISELEKQLTQMRLDLKHAGILHDEAYTPPAVDELSPRTEAAKPKKKSKVEEMVLKKDPFG